MKKWGAIISGGGATALSLLSCVLCPLCLPFYIGGLTLLGLELESVHHLLAPLVIFSSIVTLGIMTYQTYHYQGRWWPLLSASLGAFGLMASHFYDNKNLLYVAIPLFIGSIWWNRRYLQHGHHA